MACPDTYRGAHAGREDAGRLYAEDVRRACGEIVGRRGAGSVAAFFCESMVGCAGQMVLPEGYLRHAYAHVRAAGGVCVADEVQTGFGRCGPEHFWAFQLGGADVVPDIVTLGKPAGNGYPLAAVVTTPAIAESFCNGMEYFNTFGGNPVACSVGMVRPSPAPPPGPRPGPDPTRPLTPPPAAAQAVLDVIEREELAENAAAVGAHLLAGLRGLQRRCAVVGDVRGVGLFIGIEFVWPPEDPRRPPATVHAKFVKDRCRERGFLVSTDGPFDNVIKIKPPMCFSVGDADGLLAALEGVLLTDLDGDRARVEGEEASMLQRRG